MNSQSEKQIATATNLEKAWCEAFQIRKAFIDHFDRSVPVELLSFTHQRLDAILALDQSASAVITESKIIERAAVARPSWRWVSAILGVFFLIAGGLLRSTTASHFIQAQRDLLLGMLIGSLLQTGVVFASRRAWDRYLWLKWFSHQ